MIPGRDFIWGQTILFCIQTLVMVGMPGGNKMAGSRIGISTGYAALKNLYPATATIYATGDGVQSRHFKGSFRLPAENHSLLGQTGRGSRSPFQPKTSVRSCSRFGSQRVGWAAPPSRRDLNRQKDYAQVSSFVHRGAVDLSAGFVLSEFPGWSSQG